MDKSSQRWEEAEDYVKEYVRELEEEHHYESDYKALAFEAMLLAIFGEDIFERLNPLMDKYEA